MEQKYSESDSIYLKIKNILTPRERLKFILLMGLSVITAFTATVSVGVFMPFIALLMNIRIIHSNKYLSWLYQIGRFDTDTKFVIYLGFGIIGIIIFSNVLLMFTDWIKNRFVQNNSHLISKRMLQIFLSNPYEFMMQKNSSELLKSVLNESHEFANRFLYGTIDLLINVIMLIFYGIMLLLVDVKITLIVLAFFISTYGLITLFIRKSLKKNGYDLIWSNSDRFKAAHEALNSFKITKALGIEAYFIERYSKSSRKSVIFQSQVKTMTDMPKYLMDIVVFSAIILVIIMMIISGKEIDTFIPLVSLFAYAGYRMMPLLSHIFKSVTQIINNKPLLDKVYYEMFIDTVNYTSLTKPRLQSSQTDHLHFDRAIDIKNVSFKYIESEDILKNINLSIRKNSIVGFAGTTGAGKTTLIDIIMGLLIPQEGGLFIDDMIVTESNVRSWRKMIGYVPQDVFLIDDTIRNNIGFGIPSEQIDDAKIKRCAKIASISEFIENDLPQQYLTVIGERGVRMSGGQRQRLGLARALYRDPQVLVLDEATSALDGATEESVLTGIHQSSNVKTIIIIAHRLDTLKVCDQIYLLEKGEIIDQGTYHDLISGNETFMRMAKIKSN